MNWWTRSRVVQALHRAGWSEFVLLVSVAGLCMGVWVFAEVADEVLEGEFQHREEAFMRRLRAADDPARPIGPLWAEEIGRDLTALGGVAALTLLTVLVAGFQLLGGKRRSAGLLLVATAGGLLFSTVLKNSFDRPRPDVVPHLSHAMTSSFPSGHSMLSSVTYLTLGALLARTTVRRRLKVYCIGAALLLSALVGASRVYMGVHYPSDVLAGWAAGTSWALFVWLVARWLQSRGAVEREPGDDLEAPDPT